MNNTFNSNENSINIIDIMKEEAGIMKPEIFIVRDCEGTYRGIHLTWKTAEMQLLDMVEGMCKHYIERMANNNPEYIKHMYEDMVLNDGFYDYEAAIEVLHFDIFGFCTTYNLNDDGKVEFDTNKVYSYRDLESTQALINERMHIELRRYGIN